MSVTNTQLIHRTVSSTTMTSLSMTTSSIPPIRRSFFIPTGSEKVDDMGLVMRLDSKMDGGVGRPVGSTPVPAKLCGQSKAVAQWALWTWTFQIQKVSDGFQRLLNRLLPVMLYMSLLVSAIQAAGVLYLLTKSLLPLGVWFLLACIAIMCYFYVQTLLQGLNSSTTASSPRRTPSRTNSTSSSTSSSTPSVPAPASSPSQTENLPSLSSQIVS